MAAQIICAAFQQTDADIHRECATHQRQIGMKELILQVPGAGGNDDALAGDDRRYEVGEGLADTGTGFTYKVSLLLKCNEYRLGQMLLFCARRKTLQQTGYRSVITE